ncbi:hypothetical protein BSKO_12383 [Bryopsis sp. KO-2023]|nr:hypothetical protein BSKO_12383 [Bryopsis sp. KO-2023]
MASVNGAASGSPRHVAPASWLVCFCSVEFDLDVGQKMEHVVPSDSLTTQEQSDIAFHAFPDSMSLELHACSSVRDSLFFVRTRRERLLYGFVFCRQRQDERLARGGDQRAVVVVSTQPFSGILRPLTQLVGLDYFNGGAVALDETWEETRLWAAPNYTKVSQLLLKNHTLVTQLPAFSLFPPPAPGLPPLPSRTSSGGSRRSRSSLSRASFSKLNVGRGGSFAGAMMWDGAEGVVPMFSDSEVFGPFESVLPKLWSLWELALTGQPLAIIAPTPGECSMAVASLISLISPVPYSEDFRPYYTIHDATFHELIMAHEVFQKGGGEGLQLEAHLPRMIGLTNLYFLKALPRWPNVLSIGEKPTLAPGFSVPKSRFQKFNPRYAIQALRERGLGAQVLLSQHVENLWMGSAPLVRPDLELCRVISSRGPPGTSKRSKGGMSSRSDSLRKHFASLTAAFLEPFQGYFVPIEGLRLSEIPADMGCSGLPEFDEVDFMESLATWPFARALTDRIPSQRDLTVLYERFLASPNFRVWFSRHQKLVAQELGLPHGEIKECEQVPFAPRPGEDTQPGGGGVLKSAASSVGKKPLGKKKKRWDCGDEVRMVEEFFRLEGELAADGERWEGMAEDFAELFLAMPTDLRQTLFVSPTRADLVERLKNVPKAREEILKLSLDGFE